MTAVSLLVTGTVGYAIAARECVLSLLDHTDFNIHIACDHVGRMLLPSSPQIHIHAIPPRGAARREDLFLAKFDALKACIDLFENEPDILMIDANVIAAREITSSTIASLLSDKPMAMVEQKQTIGSGIDRYALYRYYRDEILPMIEGRLAPPTFEEFRYFNSGVALLERKEALRIINWVQRKLKNKRLSAQNDQTFIADQDYFQVWANSVRPNACTELPWQYNHCALWHEHFPRDGAVFNHFSNFCLGPTLETLKEVQRARRPTESQLTNQSATPTFNSKLTVVVVCYNSAKMLPLCLEYALHLTRHIIVVDNASTDETAKIAEGADVTLIRNHENFGFGSAANSGVRAAKTEYVCILNPDCIVTDVLANAAVRELDRNPKCLLVPDYCDWNGRRTAGRQPGYTRLKIVADLLRSAGLQTISKRMERLQGYHDHSWHWPVAACLFAQRSVFVELGGFDETYFLYMEDVRLGGQAAERGIETRRLPGDAIHIGAHGSNVESATREMRINEARLQYARETFGRPFAAVARLLLMTGKIIRKRPA